MDLDYRSGSSSCSVDGRYRAVTPIQDMGSTSVDISNCHHANDEKKPLLDNEDNGGSAAYSKTGENAVRITSRKGSNLGLKTYKRRFYILIVYCWMSFSFGMLWSTWGPIAHSAEQVLGFTAGDISLLQNSGPIGFLLTFLLLPWLLDKKGIRWVMVICSTLIFLGSGIRCFMTLNRDAAIVLIYIGQFMIGITICLTQVMAPVISAVWFPAEQRATATALGALASPIGMAVFGAIEPYIVTEHDGNNGTIPPEDRNFSVAIPNTDEMFMETINTTLSPIDELQFEEMVRLVIIQTVIVAGAFFCVVFYYPSQPPVPPTMSQSVTGKKSSFKDGARKLLKMPHFWILCIATSVPCGVGIGWLTLLDVNLKELGIPQQTAGWLVFIFLISGVVAGIILGRIGDCLAGRFKTMTIILYTIGSLSMLWFTLQILKYIPYHDATVFISAIICGITLSGGRPIILEMVLELTFPISPGISLSILQLVLNITMFLFYFIPMIPGVGTLWMNWAFTVINFIALPMLFFFKPKYNRLRLDSLSPVENGKTPDNSNDLSKPKT